MKKITLLLTMALASYYSTAQLQEHTHRDLSHPNTCGSSIETNRIYEENPEFAAQDAIDQANFQIEYENFLESWSPDDRSSYIVPVVVHVVHTGGPENISDEQIFNAIEHLNADFNKTNTDLASTIDEFEDITGNCDIEFRLATKDNSGNCHPGITRTYSTTTYDTGLTGGGVHPIIEAVQDEHGNWPQNKYMNIIVCIDPNGNAGYTYRPAGWYPSAGMIGSIIMRHDYMGSIGTSSSGRKHTLSHESGHWLNLAHPWGNSNTPTDPDNCDTDDGVDDTPNTIGWDNCSDVYGETCGSLDNVQNIMDYSYCSTMFTEGQAARVQTALLGAVAQRYKLSQGTNLTATGTDGPGDLCVARFSSSTRSVCAGSTIDFSDLSYHTVTTREWTFEGGSPATSGSENPTITYNTPGVYNVTLDVSHGGDSETANEDNYIIVLPSTGTSLPYFEGFETLSDLPDNERFIVENNGDAATWELTTSAAESGSKSAYINNYGVNDESRDALVSGTIDLSDVDEDDDMIFNFKYAYERQEEDNDEWIRFYISKNCGETWALRKNIHGDDLGPDVSPTSFTPEGAADWREVNITNILSDYYVSDFRFKIEFQNDNGNNIFIDNINLYPASMSSLYENSSSDIGISVYPNPLKGEATIELDAAAGEDYRITLYNAVGAQLTNIYNGQLVDGKNTIQWSTENLAKGIYILRVESQGKTETIKLVKD